MGWPLSLMNSMISKIRLQLSWENCGVETSTGMWRNLKKNSISTQMEAIRAAQALQGLVWLPPTRAALQLATVGAVLTKTAKLPPAATAMSYATSSTTAAMTSHQLAAIVRAQHKISATCIMAVCFISIFGTQFPAMDSVATVFAVPDNACLKFTLDPTS